MEQQKGPICGTGQLMLRLFGRTLKAEGLTVERVEDISASLGLAFKLDVEAKAKKVTGVPPDPIRTFIVGTMLINYLLEGYNSTDREMDQKLEKGVRGGKALRAEMLGESSPANVGQN
jgi:hypothetical protein